MGDSTTFKVKTGCGTLTVTIVKDKDKIVNVFCKMGGGAGGCQALVSHMMATTTTTMLMSGVSLVDILKLYKDQACGHQGFYEGKPTLSCYDAFAVAMNKA